MNQETESNSFHFRSSIPLVSRYSALASSIIGTGETMHLSSTTTSRRSWLLPLLMTGCLFTSLLTGVLTIFLYVELRHGGGQIQELKQLAAASKAEIASCVLELRRMPLNSVSYTPSQLPVTPLPVRLAAPRSLSHTAATGPTPRVEKEGKSDIPENGQFVLVNEDVKKGGSQEGKFKLLGDK